MFSKVPDEKEPADWYTVNIATFEKLSVLVKKEITNKLLESPEISLKGIESRSKSLESYLKKIERKGPDTEIEDLAGVRVTCYYESDLPKLMEILQGIFWLQGTWEDKTAQLGVDRMGYGGVHGILKLPESWKGPEYDSLHGLKCEVQLRTVLQDAWSSISHHLTYKREADIPLVIRRDLNNAASLLEVSQKLFEDVNRGVKQYLTNLAAQPKASESLPIDFETLKKYTLESFPDKPYSPDVHDLLLRDLNRETFRTIRDISVAVEEARDFVKWYSKLAPGLFKYGNDYITKSIGFTNKDFRKIHRFAPITRRAFEAYEEAIKAGHGPPSHLD